MKIRVNNMDWFKKHVDTVIIIGGILSTTIWMNTQFSKVDKEIFSVKTDIALLNKDISLIKAVMLMKNIMPPELAKENEEK